MTDRLFLKLYEPEQAHQAIIHAWNTVKPLLGHGKSYIIEVRAEKRSDAQNRRLWSQLNDLSEQVDWYGQKLTSSEWKDVMSAGLKRTKVVPGIDGGFVVCGQSTSAMTKAEMNELLALIEEFGARHNVAFKAYGDQE